MKAKLNNSDSITTRLAMPYQGEIYGFGVVRESQGVDESQRSK